MEEKTMTLKELSQLTSVAIQTLRNNVKKHLPLKKTKKGQTIKLNKEESSILLNNLRKQGFVAPLQNGEVALQNGEVDILKVIDGLNASAQSMNNLAAAIMANVQKQDLRIEALETKFQKRQDLLPAPQIPPRREISKIIADYVKKTNGDYRDSWHELYTDFFYRTGSNHSLCAKNRGMKTIDYIEQEGQISGLLATARELFGGECG